MKFILNLLVIAVLGYTGYVGYKRGIVTSFIGLIAVILSVYIAFLVSNTYSEEFMGLVQPFAGGLVDTAITDFTASPHRYSVRHSSGMTLSSKDGFSRGKKSRLPASPPPYGLPRSAWI